ncbi:ATP-binding protein [Haloplanus litoreus]|uniref:histidine kinase n=1 Tax=Haloplanus litoreus TaxID=767515 RepID=A0ABD5ZXM3_9EURY
MQRQTEVGLRAAYDDLHVGVALYDPDTGTVLDANDRLESMFGFPTAELRELSVGTYTANTHAFSEDEFLDRLRASASGERQEFIWRVKRGDGELVWVRLYLSRRASDERTLVRAEVRDITDSYHTSRREELFWRLLRHNLRNEANVLTGHSERIATHAETEPVREAVAVVRDTAADLGRMAESVTQIEQAMVRTGERQRRRVATVIRDVADDLTAEHPAATVTITERERMWTHVDDSFTHAVAHTLENAIFHGGEATRVVRVVVGPSPNTGRVEIRIEDDNPPIPAAELSALDDREETTPTSHGSGVGLFVMKWCIESLGGELEIETGDPRGNTVSLYLPPKEPPDHA